MFKVEALVMGRTVMFVRAKGEKAARRQAAAMQTAFPPRDGREIVLRGPEAPLAWWTARASCWQSLGPPARV